MANESDDDGKQSPITKSHLKLVKTPVKQKLKGRSKYSKKEMRLACLLMHLHACRSLLDGFESAVSRMPRATSSTKYLADRVDPRELSNEVRSQANVAAVLIRDVNEGLQIVADFCGTFAELVVLTKRESEYVSGAARRLKAVDEYLAEAVRLHRNKPGGQSE